MRSRLLIASIALALALFGFVAGVVMVLGTLSGWLVGGDTPGWMRVVGGSIAAALSLLVFVYVIVIALQESDTA